MADLVVVGAGIGGSVLTRMAREQGIDVELWDHWPEESSSRAALAMLRKTWHWDTDEALLWYDSIGALDKPRVFVTDDPRKDGRWGKGFYRVDPRKVLLAPDRERRWKPGTAAGTVATVVSHQACSPGILPDSYGVTWVSKSARVPEGDIRLHYTAPYRGIFAVQGDGECLVGSSASSTAELALSKGQEMLEAAIEHGLVTDASDWQRREGVRYQSSPPELRSDAVWDLGGFARLGFTLAPTRCKLLLEELRRSGL